MIIHRSARAVLAVATVLATTAVLTACAAAPHNEGQSPEPTPAFTGEVPHFDGPYADEFADFYTRATSDFVRDALKDGQITDAEYAEMTSRFTSCLADQGITFKGFAPDGGFSTSDAPHGGDTNSIVDQCSRASGEDSIGALRSWMSSNPKNLDAAPIIAECLVRKGVVPPDYSVDDFVQDSAGRFADIENLPPDLYDALVACSTDPFGNPN